MARKATTTDPLAIPKFLRIPQAQRAKAWAGRPLTTMPFVKLQRDDNPDAVALRQQLKTDANTALLNRLARSKARKETAKIDYSAMRWDPRKGKFVPDTGNKVEPTMTVTMVKEGTLPPRSDTAYWDKMGKACDRLGLNNSDGGLFNDWSRVNSTTARALAELNGYLYAKQ